MSEDIGVTIVSGSGRSVELAEKVYDRLNNYYSLPSLDIITPISPSEMTPEQKKARDGTTPYVAGRHADGETRIEVGVDALEGIIQGHQVVVVEDFLDGVNGGKNDPHINDNVMEAIGIMDMVRKIGAVNVALASGYVPNVRAHSFEKYEQQGLIQGRTLNTMVTLFRAVDLDEIITIDPHSKMIWDLCDKAGIKYQDINPFQAAGSLDWAAMGIEKRNGLSVLESGIIHTQTPFCSFYRDERRTGDIAEYGIPKLNNPFVVIPDKGAYDRGYTFAVESGIGEENILWLDKSRETPDRVGRIIVNPNHYHKFPLRLKDISGRTGIIIDDLFGKGSTAEGIGCYLKGHGANRVEAWVSHTNNPEPELFGKMQYVDMVVALETNNQQVELAGGTPQYNQLFYITGRTNVLCGGIKMSNYALNHGGEP